MKEVDRRVSRRSLLAGLGGLLGVLATLAAGFPLVGLAVRPLWERSRARGFALGTVANFPPGRVVLARGRLTGEPTWEEEAMGIERPIYVSRSPEGEFTLFRINCTHAGCPIRWNEQAQRFFSPCHGGVFDREGRVLAGPPPRPLDRYEVRIEKGVLYAGPAYRVNRDLRRV